MPVNIRLRRQPFGFPETTVILRPLLAFAGITRDSTGAVLPQARVKAFKSTTDVLSSREVSDDLGQYTVSVFDAERYYAVAMQAGTVDDMTTTVDSMAVTVDRMAGIGGVTDDNLVGSS